MKKNNLFWGLFFIAAALLILVARLGEFPAVGTVQIILTLLFGVMFIDSLVKIEWWGIFFSLAFLGILYDEPLGITEITPWTILLVAMFLSIGMDCLFKPKRKKNKKNNKKNKDVEGHMGAKMDDKSFTIYDEDDGSQFDFTSSFAGSIKYVNSDNFESANIEAKFAGMKVYFDNAMIQNGHATVNLNVSFAGVELYIPKNWRVENCMSASFGGVEERNKYTTADGPVLTLRGNVSLGGVKIIYV